MANLTHCLLRRLSKLPRRRWRGSAHAPRTVRRYAAMAASCVALLGAALLHAGAARPASPLAAALANGAAKGCWWPFRRGASSRAVRRSVPVDTLIFDIDDTLYPSSCGLSEHRMAQVTPAFMVERLGFNSTEMAAALLHEYLQRYHSTLKGLAVAEEEGRLPKHFRQEDLGAYWATHCGFDRFMGPNLALQKALRSLQDEVGMKLVAFTNAPRAYAVRTLEVLGVKDLFADERIFAVEDVMPACKPERAAFDQVLDSVGSRPARSVMFEDSMKNIRACHEMGMQTVLVQELRNTSGEALIVGDLPVPDDPAVGAVMRHIGELSDRFPALWQKRFPG